jgi:hypothetical protein
VHPWNHKRVPALAAPSPACRPLRPAEGRQNRYRALAASAARLPPAPRGAWSTLPDGIGPKSRRPTCSLPSRGDIRSTVSRDQFCRTCFASAAFPGARPLNDLAPAPRIPRDAPVRPGFPSNARGPLVRAPGTAAPVTTVAQFVPERGTARVRILSPARQRATSARQLAVIAIREIPSASAHPVSVRGARSDRNGSPRGQGLSLVASMIRKLAASSRPLGCVTRELRRPFPLPVGTTAARACRVPAHLVRDRLLRRRAPVIQLILLRVRS